MSQLTKLAKDWFELVWNQRNDDAIFELSAKNAVGYAESDIRYFSMEAFKEFRDNVLAAMPDLRMDVEAVIEQPPNVVVRWFLTGTHTGDGFGFTPTRSRVAVRGMTWLKADDDNKFVEGWDCWNQARMLQIFVGAAQGSPAPEEDQA
ncbi:ester cyclase [Bremerella sp. P1]|uniref:ester cyclase n=1 Tax=Bremerella sp. P1 TaxID=3026424 RepID=UPI002367831C|nr:ester cyclase [Bremerella sp. P1]WDI44520.1 ester cyclase [Bremerella sp. P1]